MSAQIGNSVVLSYGPQGVGQQGDEVVLSYQPVAATRRVTSSTSAQWSTSNGVSLATTARYEAVQFLDPQTGSRWGEAQDLQAAESVDWGIAKTTDMDKAMPWSMNGAPMQPQCSSDWGVSGKQDIDQSNTWGRYDRRMQPQAGYFWVVSRAVDEKSNLPWGGFMVARRAALVVRFVSSMPSDAVKMLPWNRYSNPLNPGWGLPTPPNPNPDDPDYPIAETLYILPARFYMTAHTVVAHRMPDEAPIHIFDPVVSADAGSYCWTLSASGPAELFELLAPVGRLPAQIRVTLDGIPFLFAVSVNYSGGFAKSLVSITGRSVTSLIAAPYLRASTRTNTEALTAQQLAVAALSGSGIGLDWGLVDWLVPTGAWNHQGTPLDALQVIARSAGGYLQSHRNDAVLSVRHPYAPRPGNYPGAPWEWMTGPADVELASDSIITEGLERQDGGDINAVYVSGTTQGVLALVKRAGSAGDKLANMVTDQLLTHTTAARQRGLSILGPAGPYLIQRFELPVLTGAGQPGVLDVGQLVQVNEPVPWRGRVRSVSVGYKRPALRQTITLERHLEAA